MFFSAINAKTLKVEFNKAISKEDQAKVTFETKRGTINVSLTAKWAEDGKSVELASSSNLIAGDYTVTAKGLEFKEASGTVKVEAVKATALTVKSTQLNDETAKAKVVISLADQYGQDMALSSDAFTTTAYNLTQGKSATLAFDTTDKYFYINTVTTPPASDDFKANDVVKVTFLHKATGLQATADLTVVAGAYVDTITFGEIELPKGKDMLTADLKDVKIPYTAKDQFGNDIALNITPTTGNTTLVLPNENIIKASNVSLVTEEKVTKVKIASFVKEGKVSLTLMGNASGKTASVELDVLKAPGEVATVTVLEPEVTIAAGSTGYVGLEVTDMYGKKLEAKDYASKLTPITSSNPAVVITPPTVEASGTNAGKVKVDVLVGAAKDATTTIAINFAGKQVASFVVKAGEAAAPTTVEVKADSKHKTTLAKGAETTVTFEAKDQYGNKLGDVAGYTIETKIKEAGNTNISLAGANTALSTAAITVKADKVGSATLVVELKKGTEVKDSKEIGFTVVANESTAGIKVSDIPTLYKGAGTGYVEDVKVETADGIALPGSSIISVTSNRTAVQVVGDTAAGWKVQGNGGASDANLDAKDGKPVDTKAMITVVYNADDKVVTLEKEVTVSAADLKADSILAVDKQQDAGTGVLKKLADGSLEVSTINVADFNELKTYAKAFAVVKDNFGKYVNAKTAGTDHNTVTVTVANKVGYQDVSSDDAVTINANGQLDFAKFGENLINSENGKASFRIIILANGKTKEINVNVAGGKTVDQDAVATAKTALTTLPFDATNDADHATAPKITKPANHTNGATYALAVSDVTGAGLAATVNGAGDIEITRGTAAGTFKVTVTIAKGSATDTKVFTVTVPEIGATPITVTVAAI